ncbi:STAS domain-containing protein [Aquabacterium sp.]|uniref:STAS domain-containing protein n=1 Tax=Aquabacterium sp. TaxID=1872578 RepID=UPI00403833C6
MSAPLTIEGELTVFTVHELKVRLLAALGDGQPLQIDLSGVSEVDGAGIQLLLAAQREARQHGAAITLLAVPPQVEEALTLADLTHEFDADGAQALEHTA